MSETIAVWFSCGAASAVAAKLTIEKYGATHNIRILNNPVLEEGDDNQRFLRDVSAWLDWPIEHVTNPKYPLCSTQEVFDRRKAMVFPHGAPCTFHLKKEARQIWEKSNHVDWLVLGFTAEERGRHDRFCLTERSDLLPVLIDAGMTKQDCVDYLINAGIELPESYRLGFPNANCTLKGCVKVTSPTYWNFVRRVRPEGFASMAEQSRRLGSRLVRFKGKRIYLDELPADAKGRELKSVKMPDCGVFCEEELPMTEPSQTQGHTREPHDWHERFGLICCTKCGFVKNDTSDVRGCLGKVFVVLRAKATGAA